MRDEFLEELKKELAVNNIENREEILKLYEKRFDLGHEANMTDEEIIQSLDSISDIIDKYKKADTRDNVDDKNRYNVSLELSVFSNFKICRTNQMGITFDLEDKALSETEILVDGKSVSLKSKSKFGGHIKVKKSCYEGTMYIGNNAYFDNLSIEAFACDVDAKYLCGNSLSINSLSGDLDLGELNFDSIKLNTTSGDFNIKRLNAKDTNISTISGDYMIDDINTLEGKIKTISGDVEIVNSSDAKYNISTISGDVIIRNGVSLNNVKASAVSGEVIVGKESAGVSITDQINETLSKIKF